MEVFEMERPPFFDTLPGMLLWLVQLDIDLDVQARLSEIRRLISSARGSHKAHMRCA
jgi:hypothetical protein